MKMNRGNLLGICALITLLIFLFFLPIENFLIDYYEVNGKKLFVYDYAFVRILKYIFIVIAGLVLNKKTKSVRNIDENKTQKVFISSFVIWVILTISVFWGSYPDFYGILTGTLGLDNTEYYPRFLIVAWNELFNGNFFCCVLACVTICFFNVDFIKKFLIRLK